MADNKKFSLKLNNNDKIEQLLQETYNLADRQYVMIQNEINKIVNGTKLNELDIDGKDKYGKILTNYIALQQKTISQKYDIGKLLAEIVKHNGDINSAIEATKQKSTTLDVKKLRELALQAANAGNDTTTTYETKK